MTCGNVPTIMPTLTRSKSRLAKPNKIIELLAQVLAPAGEAVTVADAQGKIIAANDAVERVYRWPRESIIGAHPLKFCPDTDYWPALSREIFRGIDKNGEWDGVVINHDAAGRRFPILLRTRKFVYGGVTFSIGYARPFPSSAPFGLSTQESRCFTLLGQGSSPKEIAASMDTARSTIDEYFKRVWKKTDQRNRPFSLAALKRLAVQCLEAGWDSTMRINSRLLKAYQADTNEAP